jgi:hypothetical protein
VRLGKQAKKTDEAKAQSPVNKVQEGIKEDADSDSDLGIVWNILYSTNVLLYRSWPTQPSGVTRCVRNRKKRYKNSDSLMQKTTTPRIPAWSPTVVLTGRHSG